MMLYLHSKITMAGDIFKGWFGSKMVLVLIEGGEIFST